MEMNMLTRKSINQRKDVAGRQILRTRAGRRGSLAVEAAIFLPLFLIGMLTLGYLIRIVAIQENVHHALADETGRLAAEAPLPLLSPSYQKDVSARVSEENGDRVGGIRLSPVRYRVSWAGKGKSYSDLIGVSLSYDVLLRLPALFMNTVRCGDTVLTRAFVGAETAGNPMPFSEMEKGDDGNMVWIFPRAGEKYHGENCSYIKNHPRETLLSPAVRSRYHPCALCKPGQVSNGTLVYCFPTAGAAYHLGNCYQVERYVIEIDEVDAKKKNYTPCSKCGGNG
jgi:hypothetical protein